MIAAADLESLAQALWLWHTYDPALKSDLFSSAAMIGDRLFLIDPIPLATAALSELTSHGKVSAVIVTNANHGRAAMEFAARFDVPIFASAAILGWFDRAKAIAVSPEKQIARGVATVSIEGAAPGEIAIYFAKDGGTIVVGDSLINFEPYGFTFLPPKYCADHKQMRRSLGQLLDWEFDRLLFAHGTPLISGARARVEALLTER